MGRRTRAVGCAAPPLAAILPAKLAAESVPRLVCMCRLISLRLQGQSGAEPEFFEELHQSLSKKF